MCAADGECQNACQPADPGPDDDDDAKNAQCAARTQADCTGMAQCEEVYGVDVAKNRVYAGCRYAPKLCNTVLACGRNAANIGQCLGFADTCWPPGWDATECGFGGCPSMPFDGGGEVPAPDCSDAPMRTAAEQETIEFAKAIGEAAEPTRKVAARLLLVDANPRFEAVEMLLEEGGAENIERSTFIAMISASMPAALLAEVECWPGVRAVEIDEGYWEIVEPSWDPSSVGSDECPLSDSACPEYCRKLRGQPYDPDQQCTGEPVLLACDRTTLTPPPVIFCVVRVSTGVAYASALAPRPASFLDFRDCTEQERESVLGAPACE
jgi:hypothetical protein